MKFINYDKQKGETKFNELGKQSDEWKRLKNIYEFDWAVRTVLDIKRRIKHDQPKVVYAVFFFMVVPFFFFCLNLGILIFFRGLY